MVCAKLIKLIKITLEKGTAQIKTQKGITDEFEISKESTIEMCFKQNKQRQVKNRRWNRVWSRYGDDNKKTVK